MAMIPPGPQIPFSKDRTYGQEPGFVSRNMGKVILLLVLFGVVAVALFISATANQNSGHQGQQAVPTQVRR